MSPKSYSQHLALNTVTTRSAIYILDGELSNNTTETKTVQCLLLPMFLVKCIMSYDILQLHTSINCTNLGLFSRV